jgi:hypothetical protein
LGGHQRNVKRGRDREGAPEIRRRMAVPAGTMMVSAMPMAVATVTIVVMVILRVVILMTIVIVVMHV